MELTSNTNLLTINNNELANINGGSLTLATVLFVALGYKVTVGVYLAAGAAIGLVAGGAVVIKG